MTPEDLLAWLIIFGYFFVVAIIAIGIIWFLIWLWGVVTDDD